jgi:glycosyltransferase involved in cell wall biosynthesis
MDNPKPRLALYRGGFGWQGIGVTDWRIGLYLQERGFETWLLTTEDLTTSAAKDINVVQLRTALRLPVLYTIVTSLLAARSVLELQPNVFICQPMTALAGIICRVLLPKTKILVDVRSVPVEGQGLIGLISRTWFHVAMSLRWYDAATVITAGMLDLLDGRYSLRQRVPTAVWESGFDEAVFLPRPTGSRARKALGLRDEFVLMFHGSLSPTRGLDQVIRSLRLLRDRRIDNVYLVFIGDGIAKADLASLAAQLGIADRVKFIPIIPHEETPQWLAAADLGLDPLPDHPWWHYQSPLKVIEYLAMGVPVLATDLPCHRGISEAVILTPDNRPSNLAEAIVRIRELPVRQRRILSETALRDAQQHTWRVRAEVLADFIYDQCSVGDP